MVHLLQIAGAITSDSPKEREDSSTMLKVYSSQSLLVQITICTYNTEVFLQTYQERSTKTQEYCSCINYYSYTMYTTGKNSFYSVSFITKKFILFPSFLNAKHT